MFQRPVSCNNHLRSDLVLNLLTQLNLPPKRASNSSSSLEASQTKPVSIPRPRRPLWIISRQDVNSMVEFQVHWNSGRNSWESHDSLYRDYPRLVENFLRGPR